MVKRIRLTTRFWAQLMAAILLFLAAFFLIAARYKSIVFKDSQIDEIIFYFVNGLAGSKSDNLWSAVFQNLPLVFILFGILLLPIFDKVITRLNRSLAFCINKIKLPRTIILPNLRLRHKLIYSLSMFLIAFTLLIQSFGIPAYIHALTQSTKLYEENYVNPKTAQLTFPEKKRNLIYIYLESMENTLASKANGGSSEVSIIPELEELALKNTFFSNKPSGLGGALPAANTGWTVAGMAAQSAGVPLKENLVGGRDHNALGEFKKFLPGAYSLGEILQKQGYNQTFIMGSEASFGGRDKLLTQHGNFTIQDYNYAKQ
ncbi:MAG: hypothetical protein D8G53_15045, partial [Candidatus Saccharimonas sp.]